MQNIPKIKVGVVAVSRDCFPESLSVSRRQALIKAYTDKYGAEDIYECPVCIVESEIHIRVQVAVVIFHADQPAALDAFHHHAHNVFGQLRHVPDPRRDAKAV